ncbi:MAG: radical SAM family heme chaperone HemW [Cyclobacteriaceae bacterium]|nr:radical SAM family heme chaperone HemW [Cyclobacteriaceae bacterium]
MAGIYIHIPFCRQACYYCDFHFSTSLSLKEKMVKAIMHELKMQYEYLSEKLINTIYFGGGTPSLLSESELNSILDVIYQNFNVSNNPEITLEANPDDLSLEKLKTLKRLGINRLSIGVQSFHEPHLNYLNRIHTSFEATNCINNARLAGFKNISIDLIYGLPSNNHDIWLNDLDVAIKLNVEHISSYCLTIEEKTVFGNWVKKGKISSVEDDFSAQQFEIMVDILQDNGFEQYEVSNFSKPELHSQHNSNYWQQVSYLGVGPGAHSFNGKVRQYNISNNPNYLKAINNNEIPYTLDELSINDFINERILISLRTKWGLDTSILKNHHGYDLLKEKSEYIKQLKNNDMATINEGVIILNTKGMLLADHISSELFID